MFGYKIVKALGESMSPTVLNGAYLIVKRQSNYSIDDVIHVRHTYYGNMVKRIISGDLHKGFYVAGDNAASLSIEQMGLINSAQILGKVSAIINPSIES